MKLIKEEVIINSTAKTTNIYDEAARRLEELKAIQAQKEQSLSKSPKGKIHVAMSKGRVKYYLRLNAKDKTGVYLPKNEALKIKIYLQKFYDEKVLKGVSKEITALERLLNTTSDSLKQIREVYSSYPEEMKSQIDRIDVSDEEYANQWLKIPYEGKVIGENVPIYKTNNGEFVRSKSELTIANALAKKAIPYKYECPLELKSGAIIHPDFTILNVSKRKVIYWEHRGMMDDRDYAKHSVLRIKDYLRNGICLGDNLIITEETSTLPLGTNEIEQVICQYFD